VRCLRLLDVVGVLAAAALEEALRADALHLAHFLREREEDRRVERRGAELTCGVSVGGAGEGRAVAAVALARGVQARVGAGRTGAENAELGAIPLVAVVLEVEVEGPLARADAEGVLALRDLGEDEARLAQRRLGCLLDLRGRVERAGRQAPAE